MATVGLGGVGRHLKLEAERPVCVQMRIGGRAGQRAGRRVAVVRSRGGRRNGGRRRRAHRRAQRRVSPARRLIGRRRREDDNRGGGRDEAFAALKCGVRVGGDERVFVCADAIFSAVAAFCCGGGSNVALGADAVEMRNAV